MRSRAMEVVEDLKDANFVPRSVPSYRLPVVRVHGQRWNYHYHGPLHGGLKKGPQEIQVHLGHDTSRF